MGCIKSVADDVTVSIRSLNVLPVGASAKDLLSDEKYRSLFVEVHYMKGAEPHPEAIAALRKFLNERLHKPDGITIYTQEIPTSKDTILTKENIAAIEDTYRTKYTTDDEIAVYILFANGEFIDHRILGTAYRNTSAALFGRHIRENSNLFKKPSRTYVETLVLQHEMAHLLGLVNIGSPVQTDHVDYGHGKHCINKHCLMYCLTDTEDYPSILIKKTPPSLDDDCLNDLRANGGK